MENDGEDTPTSTTPYSQLVEVPDVTTLPEDVPYPTHSSRGDADEEDQDTISLTNEDDKSSNVGSPYGGLPMGRTPFYRAIFLISNAALGAGLLNFPQAYMRAGGVATAIAIQLVLLVFILGAFVILARCADKYQAPTYQDLILFMLGNRTKNICQTCIVIYFFGTAITYIIIIGEQMSSVLELITGHTNVWYTNKKLLFVFFSLLCLFPLCIQRQLKALSYTSFFGGLGAFFITGIIIHNYYTGDYAPDPKDPELVTDWKSVFCVLPVLCFGFQCHVSSVVVYSDLRNRSASKFFWCAFAAMMVCAVTYTLCGSYGSLTFKQSTNSDILTNYSDHDTLVNIARVCILLILLSSFSIVTFCARTVVDKIIIKYFVFGGPAAAEATESRRRWGITLTWFLGALLLALIVPNIGVAIALISGVASLFIFVFPGLCLLKSVNLRAEVLKVHDIVCIVIAAVYLVIGGFIFGLVTVLAIQQDVQMRHLS